MDIVILLGKAALLIAAFAMAGGLGIGTYLYYQLVFTGGFDEHSEYQREVPTGIAETQTEPGDVYEAA